MSSPQCSSQIGSQNVSELKSYLGLLTYYSKFLPHLSNVLAILYRLLYQSSQWQWGQVETEAFKASKELLTSAPLLVHFDPKLQLTLACDASAYGIGAVLSHKSLMDQKSQLGLPPVLYLRQRNSILRSKRRV